MKNPMPLAINDKIANVSVLNQVKRWDTGIASYIGLVKCITKPSSQDSKPYKNST